MIIRKFFIPLQTMIKVSIIQHDIAWADPMENISRLEQALSSQPAADLYVLPEMFATGFATKPEGIAEDDGGESLQWMIRKSRQLDAALAGSLAIRQQGKYLNRFYFVKPDGQITLYDKRHLFSYGQEDRRFTAGEERVITSFRGCRFLMLVCYDLRFPVWSRNLQDYDAIIYVANWPATRINAWDTLLRARAIENQCYVVGVNRVGNDTHCQYTGHSAVINPYGDAIATCPPDQQGWAQAELDMEQLSAFRRKFPVLADGDLFQIVTEKPI